MGRGGALHACRVNHEMAVDGLAGVSKGPKPESSPAPWPWRPARARRTGYSIRYLTEYRIAITIRSLGTSPGHEVAHDGH